VTSCTPMTCPAGKISSKTSSETATDGCQSCSPGKYSLGGSATVCVDSTCSAG